MLTDILHLAQIRWLNPNVFVETYVYIYVLTKNYIPNTFSNKLTFDTRYWEFHH